MKRPSRAFEPTSVTIKRARRLMNLHSLLKPSHHELDLDLGSSVVDPFVVRREQEERRERERVRLKNEGEQKEKKIRGEKEIEISSRLALSFPN